MLAQDAGFLFAATVLIPGASGHRKRFQRGAVLHLRPMEKIDNAVATPSEGNVPAGTLYLVGTPIGNLDDITLRALRVLKEVDLIACEDTRHTAQLLNHYGIDKPTISYHEHNELTRAAELVVHLERGDNVAVVSDAGMPGVSDPGYRLVALAIRHHIRVVPIPGASAFLSALVASGLPTDAFHFGGFLPAKSGARRTALELVRSSPRTQLFYEAPHRIVECLRDIVEVLGRSGMWLSRARSPSCTRNFCAVVSKTFWCNWNSAARCAARSRC